MTAVDELTEMICQRHRLARDQHNSHEARVRYEAAAAALEMARDIVLRDYAPPVEVAP